MPYIIYWRYVEWKFTKDNIHPSNNKTYPLYLLTTQPL